MARFYVHFSKWKFPAFISLLLFFCLTQTRQIGFAQEASNFFVSSRNTNSIKYFSGADGTYLGDFVQVGAGGLSKPQDLFFHPQNGTLIVTGIDNSRIKQYDGETGEFLGDFSKGYTLDQPTKMAIGPDSLIYVSQWGSSQNKVVRFDLDGQFIDEFTTIAVPSGCGMVWDNEDNLYVASWGNGQNGKVYRFNKDGGFEDIFIESGNVRGPVGIWRDTSGTFFIVDWTLGRVQQFDGQGNFQKSFIKGMMNTEGHTFDAAGFIYLCDWSANEINRYKQDGSLDKVFINNGGLVAPNSIIQKPMDLVSDIKAFKQVVIDTIIYPNPSQGQLKLSFTLREPSDLSVHLMDATGRELMHLPIENYPDGVSNLEWSIGALPAGTYWVQLRNSEHNMDTQSLIIQ